MSLESARIRLPAPVSAAPAIRLPVVASLAPVVVSLALFAVTGSTLSLLFAVLGPVTAVAGLVDSAVAAARHRRRERRRLREDVTATRERIRSAHDRERADRHRAHAAASRIARADPRECVLWNRAEASAMVRVGVGTVPSGLPVEGDHEDPEIHALATAAADLDDAPLLADLRTGIGVVGPLPAARAVARGIAIQLIAGIGPDDAELRVAGPAWGSAVAALPHRCVDTRLPGGVDSVLRFVGTEGEHAAIAVAVDPVAIAPGVAAVVRLGSDAVEYRTAAGRTAPIRVEPLDALAFTAWCAAVADAADDLGVDDAAAGLPDRVQLGDIVAERPAGAAVAVLGATTHGTLGIDLVADGPHAVVGGTTGSGKSELLVTLVASMAAGAAPTDLSLLLVDFKGGAGFAPVEHLPHVVGVVTDLDGVGALRAVNSLRAEIGRREAVLAAAGLREHAPECGLPRLVIVVDEYAALVDAHPDLHALFGDLAARGRSLGVHLVVGTQRPSASVRDAVLANADIRISLRVRDRADGVALVGNASPAELPTHPRGRAVISIGGQPPELLQVALSRPGDIARIAQRWAGAPRPRRPWRDPLPARLTPETLADLVDGDLGGDGVIGAIDRPDRQTVEPWRWHAEGLSLVIGAPGSGRTGMLDALAAAVPSVRVPAEPAAAWDTIIELAEATGDHGGVAVLVDDIDRLGEQLDPEHRQILTDRLVALVRAAPRLGLGVVVTAVTSDGLVRALEPIARRRVLLGMSSRQDYLLAGGDAVHWDARLPPGGAVVEGHRGQILAVETSGAPDARILEQPIGDTALAVVAAAPAAAAERLAAAGRRILDIEQGRAHAAAGELPRDVAVVADPAAWQAQWGALEALGAAACVVVAGLDPPGFRSVTGLRVLPPPLPTGQEWAWLVRDGAAHRTRLP